MKLSFRCLLVSLLIASAASALTVEKIVLQPRETGVFPRKVGVALNTKTGQTLVVWERRLFGREEQTISGRLLGPDGTPAGSEFKIISGPVNQVPNVIYYPDANQYLLAFTNKEPGTFNPQVFVVRLKANGKRKGKPIQISDPSDLNANISNFFPRILYDSSTKGYIILWRRGDEETPSSVDGIFAALLNADFSFRTAPVFVEPLEKQPAIVLGPYFGDIAIHKPSGQILIGQTTLFGDLISGFTDLCSLARIDTTLENGPAKVTKLKSGSSECGQVDLMQLPNGQQSALFQDEDGVKRRKIDSKGVPKGGSKRFFGDPIREVSLSAASAFSDNGSSTEIAVFGFQGSQTQSGSIWMQLASSKGKATGQPVELDSGFDSVNGLVVQPLLIPSTSGHTYALIYVEGPLDNPPKNPNESAEIELLLVNTAP